MAGFDDLGVFFSDNLERGDSSLQNRERINTEDVKKRFKEFLRNYHDGNLHFKYREEIKEHYTIGQYWVEVLLEDLNAFDENLGEKVQKLPTEYLHIFELAAKEIADELTRPRSGDDKTVQDMQVTLRSEAEPSKMRALKSNMISKLVKVSGIVIAASNVRAKATKISLQCRGCRTIIKDNAMRPGLEGFLMPRKCHEDQNVKTIKCPLDPYFIIPDKCKCVDFQTLKLQEVPESVPYGEMPRHLTLFVDRYLCEKVVPGNRVTVTGVFSIKRAQARNSKNEHKANIGTRSPYLRVVGIEMESEGARRAMAGPTSSEDEKVFRHLASQENIYERIAKSIAPSIYGYDDIKKAVACLLFSGSRKRLPDGLTRRGDINVLLLGDPGTAKSQLLKFVEKVAPIAIYTSGKGSSAAGLTASVIRDPQSRNFIMEGGAMVLADGGVVCIDEFDKMREDDRVAIHEAMEQQTISIAKAGITTTLNSRCAVFAAANSVYGRWDEMRAEQNIDFMPTILSRFDMIFIVKDEHNEKKDATLARHVMNVHMNAGQTANNDVEGELSLNLLKKYIAYCKNTCGPRLSASAAERLKTHYVQMRNGSRTSEDHADKKSVIPITIRQLEAVVRISESLAKMQLLPFATEVHVDEALRLFKVSTLAAASTGDLAGAEGFTTDEEHLNLVKIEKQIKRRFTVGTQLSEKSIIDDLMKQNFVQSSIFKVIHCMIRRGDLQYRAGRKMLYRIK